MKVIKSDSFSPVIIKIECPEELESFWILGLYSSEIKLALKNEKDEELLQNLEKTLDSLYEKIDEIREGLYESI